LREFTKTIWAEIKSFEELTETEKALLEEASIARTLAQAPYSKFWVGAAVLFGGKIAYHGCNVERCTWTQTTHAEQNAIDTMIAEEGPSKIDMIAIVAAPAQMDVDFPPKEIKKNISSFEEIIVPCGHCLQIIWENCFDDPNVKLLALLPNGEVAITTIGNALPMRFGPTHLGIDYSKTG